MHLLLNQSTQIKEKHNWSASFPNNSYINKYKTNSYNDNLQDSLWVFWNIVVIQLAVTAYRNNFFRKRNVDIWNHRVNDKLQGPKYAKNSLQLVNQSLLRGNHDCSKISNFVIQLYVLIMSRTGFRVAWMLRNSLLETGTKSKV